MPGDITGSMVIDSSQRRADLPRGPGLHQPAARRRDQPHPAQDPVGAARGDGGGPGLGRRRLPPAAPAVPGRRDPEPGRVRRHLPAARGPARPLPAQGGAADPRAGRGAGDPAPARGRLRPARRGRGRAWRPVAGAADIAAGRPRRRRGPGLARGRRLHRRHRPGHPRVALAQPRRQPARRDRADAGGPGLGLAHRPRLRDPRRRQGARPGHPRPPARRCAPRPSSRASTWRQVLASALGSVPVPR